MECDMEKGAKILHFKKKFFLKTFVISFVLFLFSTAVLYFFHDGIAEMVKTIYRLDQHNYALALALLMGSWKILIIQFTLVPFLALSCMERCCKKKMEEE